VSNRGLAAILAVAALAFAGTASAHPDGHDKTINLVEANKELQPTFVDTGQPGPSVGDLVVARDGVLRENGAPAGKFTQVCTLVELGSNPFTSTYEARSR
jgi:hypothetical protein